MGYIFCFFAYLTIFFIECSDSVCNGTVETELNNIDNQRKGLPCFLAGFYYEKLSESLECF